MQNNSGRTKVVYTRQTDPDELERASEAWTLGCTNLPRFPFGAPEVPYPLDIADTLNCLWKQNGEFVTNRFKPVSQYHGMELLMEPAMPVCSDLHLLAENAVTLSTYLGYLNVTKNWHHQRWNDAKICWRCWDFFFIEVTSERMIIWTTYHISMGSCSRLPMNCTPFIVML